MFVYCHILYSCQYFSTSLFELLMFPLLSLLGSLTCMLPLVFAIIILLLFMPQMKSAITTSVSTRKTNFIFDLLWNLKSTSCNNVAALERILSLPVFIELVRHKREREREREREEKIKNSSVCVFY